MRDWLRNYFQLEQRGSTIGTEARGALATFLTMSYILVANPAILKAAGIPFAPAVACTEGSTLMTRRSPGKTQRRSRSIGGVAQGPIMPLARGRRRLG